MPAMQKIPPMRDNPDSRDQLKSTRGDLGVPPKNSVQKIQQPAPPTSVLASTMPLKSTLARKLESRLVARPTTAQRDSKEFRP